MANYENYSVDRLEAEIIKISEKVAALKVTARELNQLRDSKLAAEQAAATVAGLGNAELAALAQAIEAKGIESEESVSGF